MRTFFDMNDEYVYPETVPAPKFEYTLFHNRYGLDFEEALLHGSRRR